tara:strand:+ start:1003 stop:1836 length:834 start_codon:yes stop_codon:yes gene_type:complete
MLLFTSKIDLQEFLNKLNEKKVGFVPTMGGLHEGHLQLIKSSINQCDITVCSIFINPTQFNNSEDFSNYPSSLDSDLDKLKVLGCDAVYNPQSDDLYEDKISSKKFDFGTLTNYMEGKFRPGHFNGVATIVEKLFNIIQPSIAFFGEKDLQQLQIIKALTKHMNSSISIKSIPTVRENNGLAKSTRNKRLSKQAQEEAAEIYRCLSYCKKNKNQGIRQLKKQVVQKIINNKNLELEYIEFVDLESMTPIKKWGETNKNAICIAAYHSGIRLIDNIIL